VFGYVMKARISIVMPLVACLGGCAAVALPEITPSPAWAPPEAQSLAPDEATQALAVLHHRYRGENGGKVSDHNEVAAAADPDRFGIAIATVDGSIISVGDAKTRFPLQSLSKVFNFALALEQHGSEELLSKVGTYATGLPFDSLLATEVRATRLQNTMVSSGAIAVVSLLAGEDEQQKWQSMQRTYSEFAGGPVPILEDVFAAETGDDSASLAKAWVLEMYGLLYCRPEDAVRRYLRGCSVGVTVEELAVMGATLANWGVNPLSGRRVIDAAHARGVLSAMVTSGMYDDSGPWLYRVGLPAKSGVSGGVVAVVPDRFAIAVYSPLLDERGNSVRADRVIAALSDAWGLHLLEPPDHRLPSQ